MLSGRRDAVRARTARPSSRSAEGGPDDRGRARDAPRPASRSSSARSTSTSSSRARRPTRSSSCWPSSATSGTRATPTRTPTRPPRARHASTARCTTRSPSRTARWTTRPSGRPTTAADHYQQLYFGEGNGVESLKTYYETQSSGRYSVDGEVTDWVKVRYNEARYGRSNGYPCAGNVCRNTWDLVQDAHQHVGRRPEGRRAAPTRRSRPTWRRSTSGTATTTTATATSTSRTATSTTSRSSTPAATRPTVTRSRARTPSGRTAGRRSRTPARARPATSDGGTQIGNTGLWVARLHDPARERRAVACSPTSTATTSACRTTTTPPAAATTPSSWWTLMAQSRLVAPRTTRASATRAGDLGAWDKLQLGWLDYEIVVAGQNTHARPRPARVQLRQGPGRRRGAARRRRSPPTLGAAVRGHASSGGQRRRRRPRQHADPHGRRCRPARRTLTFQARWNIEDCGPDAVRLRLRRGRRRHRLQGRSPARITNAGRGQRHRRLPATAGRRRRSTCRRTPARRSGCGSATRPTARAQGNRRRPADGHLRRRDHGHHRRRRPCSPTAPRPAPTAGRSTASPSSARRRPTLYDNYYIAVEPDVHVATTST